MQSLEVSSAVRPTYGSLGVKRLIERFCIMKLTFSLVLYVHKREEEQNFNFEMRHPRCVGSITKNFLCITHTVEHNYISPSSTEGIQLHVSALYVGELQVVI